MPSRQTSPAPHARLLLPLAVGCLLVAGCGAHQTQHGAPPYQPSLTAAPTAIPSNYPKDNLRFTFPTGMAADQRVAARVYVDFQRAYYHALQDGKVGNELRTVAADTVVAEVRSQIAAFAKGGTQTPRTLVKISKITTSVQGSLLSICVVAKGKRSPLAALVVADKLTGDLQVAAAGKDPKRKSC